MIVLHVETGRETDIARNLVDYAPLLPMEMRYMRRRGNGWVPTLRVLMSGYLFLDRMLTDSDYYYVKDVSGVLRVMNHNNPLPNGEADMVRRMAQTTIEPHVIDKNGHVVCGFFGTEQLVSVHKRQRRAEFALTLMREQVIVKTAATFLQ